MTDGLSNLDALTEMEDLQSMAARWALDHLEALRFAEPEIPEESTRDRTRDNWRPLSPSPTSQGRNGPGGRGRAPAACRNRPPRKSPWASRSFRT